MDFVIQGLTRLPAFADLTIEQREQWLSSLHFDGSLSLPVHGTRRREVFYRCPDFEVIVVHWGRVCETQIHSHGVSQCSFVVLDGIVTEKIYESASLRLLSSRDHLPGQSTSIQSDTLSHSISSMAGAVTVHLYAKPLGAFQQFNPTTQLWDTNHGANL